MKYDNQNFGNLLTSSLPIWVLSPVTTSGFMGQSLVESSSCNLLSPESRLTQTHEPRRRASQQPWW